MWHSPSFFKSSQIYSLLHLPNSITPSFPFLFFLSSLPPFFPLSNHLTLQCLSECPLPEPQVLTPPASTNLPTIASVWLFPLTEDAFIFLWHKHLRTMVFYPTGHFFHFYFGNFPKTVFNSLCGPEWTWSLDLLHLPPESWDDRHTGLEGAIKVLKPSSLSPSPAVSTVHVASGQQLLLPVPTQNQKGPTT